MLLFSLIGVKIYAGASGTFDSTTYYTFTFASGNQVLTGDDRYGASSESQTDGDSCLYWTTDGELENGTPSTTNDVVVVCE